MSAPAPARRPQRVLVLAAHADDEVLGPGGTIARHVEDGDIVRVVIAADCRTVRDPSREPSPSDEAAASCRALGVAEPPVFLLNRALSLAASASSLNAVVSTIVADFQPDTVYAHHQGDPNSDHQAVARAALIACRPITGHAPRRLLSFETPSSTDQVPASVACFEPTVLVALTQGQLERKLAALACYGAELRDAPHPRNVNMLVARAVYWGQHAGCARAEPFVLLRELLREVSASSQGES